MELMPKKQVIGGGAVLLLLGILFLYVWAISGEDVVSDTDFIDVDIRRTQEITLERNEEAFFKINGDSFDVNIKDPLGKTLDSANRLRSYSKGIRGDTPGKYVIEVLNTGQSPVSLDVSYSRDVDDGLLTIGAILFGVGIVALIGGATMKSKKPTDDAAASPPPPPKVSETPQPPTGEVDKLFCNHCGKENPNNSTFCKSCGKKIG